MPSAAVASVYVNFRLRNRDTVVFRSLLSRRTTGFKFSCRTAAAWREGLSVAEPGGRRALTGAGSIRLHVGRARCSLLTRETGTGDVAISSFIQDTLSGRGIVVGCRVATSIPRVGGLVDRFNGVNDGLGRVIQCFGRNKVLSSRVEGRVQGSLQSVCRVGCRIVGVTNSFHNDGWACHGRGL